MNLELFVPVNTVRFHHSEMVMWLFHRWKVVLVVTGSRRVMCFMWVWKNTTFTNNSNNLFLQSWVTATDIKITLDRLNTFGDEVFGDPQVLRSYFYAISDIAVGARCKCNGHASKCVRSTGINGENNLVCECKHNTDGPDCERCLPLYNNVEWKRATSSEVNECKRKYWNTEFCFFFVFCVSFIREPNRWGIKCQYV